MTAGQPQVSKLWLGVSKSMLPVKHLAPKIIMAVNYYGRQLDSRFLAPAYCKKEGATLHTEAHKCSLQYDGRPDGHFGMQVWTWNLGSLSGQKGEVCEELRNKMNDVCCLQVRWRIGCRMLGTKGRRYKL